METRGGGSCNCFAFFLMRGGSADERVGSRWAVASLVSLGLARLGTTAEARSERIMVDNGGVGERWVPEGPASSGPGPASQLLSLWAGLVRLLN